jgi:hypothetical protein
MGDTAFNYNIGLYESHGKIAVVMKKETGG